MLWQLGFIFSDSVEGESDSIGWGIMAFAVVLVVMALMPRIIRKIRRERVALQQQETSNIRNAPNIRSQADKILVDLAEISREISAQVDVKIRVLNKLIRDSEEVVSRYEKLVDRAEKIDLTVFQNKQNTTAAVNDAEQSMPVTEVKEIRANDIPEAVFQSEIEQEPPPQQPEERVISLSTYTQHTRAEALPEQGVVADTPVPASSESETENSESGSWQENIQTKVARMHKEGREINEIAGKTRLSIAEINLILSILDHKNK